MASRTTVTPNRRGMKSRELVLDAAERVMATDGSIPCLSSPVSGVVAVMVVSLFPFSRAGTHAAKP